MSFCLRSHTLFCCLVLSLNLNFSTGETFRKPSTNNDERISELQNVLLTVQGDILGLNTALALGASSSDLKERLSVVEGEFDKLKQQLANERRESLASSTKYDSAITLLNNYYNSLDIQLKGLQSLMESRIQEESNKRGPADIADAIRSHSYAKAQTLLLKMADHEKIPKIVHDVYANSEGNTAVLLDFAKALTKIDLSFYVLSALRYEMRANGHRDPYKMMELVKSMENEVVNQKLVSAEIKRNAQAVIDETNTEIIAAATETLKAAMYKDNYQKNVDVEKLANEIDNFRSEVSDLVMQRIVNEVYPTVSAVNIADSMYSNKYIPQIVAGLVALFRKLESAEDLNNKAVFSIADYLKRLSKMKNYANLSAAKKATVNSVIEKMPTCAKNLIFTETVCIWNRRVMEYLYAASDQFKWNRDRRSIFTWYPSEPVIQGDWHVEKFGDQFYFKNKAHPNEYLYAAAVDPFDKDRRFVLTWIHGGILGNKSAWNVELSGDYCYLKNENFGEYLFASDKMHSKDRRYVFTWMAGTAIRHLQSKFQWQIRTC